MRLLALSTLLGWLLLSASSAQELDKAVATLSLERVFELVEENHPKLRGAQLAQDIASAKVLQKQGAFDPNLGISSTYQLYNSSSSPGKARDYFSNSINYYRTDPSGIKWETGWINNAGTIKSPSSSTGDVGEFYVGASIPLLRGLNINDKSVGLEQAKVVEKQVRLDYRNLRLLTLLNAGSAYYNWVTAVMQREIIQENLKLAELRLEQVKASIEAGDKAEIDEVEAAREVAKRAEALLKAERIVQKSAIKLALYLWNSNGQAQEIPREELAPRTLPETSELLEKDIAEFQVQALEKRPELRRLDLQKDIFEWDKKLAENDKLPQLDLKLRPGVDTGGQSIGVTFKAGIELVLPLATRSADGRERAASIKMDKLSLDQVELVRRILLQVQDAAGEINATGARLKRAHRVYKLAKKLEEAERLKFELGDSSLFLVNTRERATVEAALKVLQIRNEQAQSILLLETVSGLI